MRKSPGIKPVFNLEKASTTTHTHTHLQFSDDGVWYIFLLFLKKVETDRVEGVGAQLRVTQEDLGEWDTNMSTQLLRQLHCICSYSRPYTQ